MIPEFGMRNAECAPGGAENLQDAFAFA